MRSRADRRVAEAVARAAACLLLVAAWALAGRPGEAASRVVSGAALTDVLPAATADGRPLHVRLDDAPSPAVLAWLRALARAGVRVTWSGDVPALAVSAVPLFDAAGATRVRVAAPAGVTASVADRLGVVDTVVATDGGAVLEIPHAVGEVVVRARGARAGVRVPDPPSPRAVVVLGRANQEAKFAVAALEERGFAVRARFAVAPRSDVEQGPLGFDTATVAAVIVLDSAVAGDAPGLVRFVRSGGGAVLAGSSPRAPGLAALRVGPTGPREPALAGSHEFAPPRRGLSVHPVAATGPGAAVLESHADAHDHGADAPAHAAVAWHAVGGGQVLQFGYDDTWRWRMLGDTDDAPARHRDLWARAVAVVAYHPGGVAPSDTVAAAPRAAVAGLGSPRAAPAAGPSRGRWHPWIFLAVITLLLGEVASRRRRGAP